MKTDLSSEVKNRLRGAIRWSSIASGVAALIIAVMFVRERWYDLTELGWYRVTFLSCIYKASWPIAGIGSIFACAGWCACNPRASCGVAGYALIMMAGSLVTWFLVAAAGLFTRQNKFIDQPILSLWDAVLLIAPPIVFAVLLTRGQRTAVDRSTQSLEQNV